MFVLFLTSRTNTKKDTYSSVSSIATEIKLMFSSLALVSTPDMLQYVSACLWGEAHGHLNGSRMYPLLSNLYQADF